MKKGLILLVILILALPLIKSDITGEAVTGQATSQPTNVSIFILPTIPTLTIISPLNRTYLTNISLLLNYAESLADNIWYSLDAGSNTTITSFLYFNTSQGGHLLFLYANNTNGETSTNVSFVANSTRFTILYQEYKGSTKGNSTNFSSIQTYEELQSQTNIILENTTSGKILFLETINLTSDATPNDNLLDLDINTNISFNRIEINTTALPNFNISATLWLYNLSFTNPRILKDGSECPSNSCVIESYNSSSGILKFNVSSFAVFSVQETSTACPPGTILCPDGTCRTDCSGGPGCTNDCTQTGEKYAICINSTTLAIKICGQYDSDSCYDWSSISYEDCNPGYECINNKCEYIGLCTEDWQCGDFGSCINNTRTANCTDLNGCFPDRTLTQPCQPQAGNCSIYFQNGWNFISICTQMENTKINNTLSYIQGLYDYILEWDESKQEFKIWSSKGTKEFDSFNPKKSYFIFYQGPLERVNLTGPLYDSLDINLLKRWNSPVYPFDFSSKISGNQFYNIKFLYMQDWDRQMQSFKVYSVNSTNPGFDTIYAGNGFLIMTENGTLIYRR